jgi:RNAse (barnase) inhibitor barstar
MNKLLSKDIVKKWKNGDKLDWRDLTTEERGEWLLACLFTTGLPLGTIPKADYLINGDEINDPVDLYCLLGQTFFEKRGYMGQGLDGLDDCFIQLEVQPGTTLTIKNHLKVKMVLQQRFDNYFDVLLDTLMEHGLNVKLE